MQQTKDIICLNCGMVMPHGTKHCLKCDNRIDQQHDGSTVTIDIAHHRETVKEALAKLKTAIRSTGEGSAQFLRVVVGSGRIREEVLSELFYMESRQRIIGYQTEDRNPGAIVIKLKP